MPSLSSSFEAEEGTVATIEVVALFEDTVLDVHHFDARRKRPARGRPREFTIGTDRTALFALEHATLPSARFPLLRCTADGYSLSLTRAMSGEVTLGEELIPLSGLEARGLARPSAEIAGAIALPIVPGQSARIALGQSTFLISSVSPPPHVSRAPALNLHEQLCTLGVAAVAALFLLFAYSMPPDSHSLALDAMDLSRGITRFLIRPPAEELVRVHDAPAGLAPAGNTGQRHAGPEGRMGTLRSQKPLGIYRLKGPEKNSDPHLAKQLAEAAAREVGVVGLLARAEGSHLASIFGRDSALGSDAESVLGGLRGTEVGEAYGAVNGLGVFGTNRGGGGTGADTIGIGGRLSTIGKTGAGGCAGCTGYGSRAGGLQPIHPRAPEGISMGDPLVPHGLSKDIIRRVVRQHLNEVRFCYEKELLRNADLYGRVVTAFTIDGTGRVIASGIQSSTAHAPAVEGCITQAIRRWEFPQPENHGAVQVAYPFLLQAPGGR